MAVFSGKPPGRFMLILCNSCMEELSEAVSNLNHWDLELTVLIRGCFSVAIFRLDMIQCHYSVSSLCNTLTLTMASAGCLGKEAINSPKSKLGLSKSVVHLTLSSAVLFVLYACTAEKTASQATCNRRPWVLNKAVSKSVDTFFSVVCMRPGTVAEGCMLDQLVPRYMLHSDLCYGDYKQWQRGRIGNLGQQHIQLY